MADGVKLSQIPTSAANLTPSDFLVGVTAGNADVLFSSSQVAAATGGRIFYVSPSGNDSADGSAANPWKTISHVNSSTFVPGDSILFQGGQTFSGAIVSPSAGTPSLPITFGSYGGGQATISSGASTGFSSTSQAGIIVRDLTFTGTASTNTGILFTNALAGDVHLQGISIINCTVSGYGQRGILVTGNVGNAGYDDPLIDGCIVSSCCSVASSVLTAGISVFSFTGSSHAIFANVKITNCISHDNAGCADVNSTGSGIFVFSVNIGLIDNCISYNNGASSTSTGGGGPVGIWLASSSNVTISRCISHNNSSASGSDGGGFDLDGGASNCTIRDCVSYNNLAYGYLIDAFSGAANSNDRCSVVNCATYGDCTGGGYGSIFIEADGSGTQTNVQVTGCSIYNTHATSGIEIGGSNAATITGFVINNQITLSGNNYFVHNTVNSSGLVFSGNSYRSPSAVNVFWVSGFTSISAWNTAYPQQEPAATLSTIALNATTINAQFGIFTGLSGSFPGVYSQITGDADSRVFLGLLSGTGFSDVACLDFSVGNTAFDIGLSRQGVGTLALSSVYFPGSPSGLFVYNTTDVQAGPPVANYERGIFDWTTTSNVLTIGTQKGGSGSVRAINLVALDIVVGTAAINTTATDGFLYIPTCAGTPTGTPTAFTGRVPMVFDTTHSQFWFYTGGAWKQPQTPAGAALVTWQ